jgi:Fungal Zn(2)-Cys(6) binuclear cluster domain
MQSLEIAPCYATSSKSPSVSPNLWGLCQQTVHARPYVPQPSQYEANSPHSHATVSSTYPVNVPNSLSLPDQQPGLDVSSVTASGAPNSGTEKLPARRENDRNGSYLQHLKLVTGQEVTSEHQLPPPSACYGPPSSTGPQVSPAYAPNYCLPHHMGPYRPSGQHRTPVRAVQACDSCRSRKSKCDELRPSCTHCLENNLSCYYREVSLSKQDKQVLALTEKLEGVDKKLTEFLELREGQSQEQTVQRKQLGILGSMLSPKNFVDFQAARLETQKRDNRTEADLSPLRPQTEDPNETEIHAAEELALPLKHTTAASTILAWPSLRTLLHPNHSEAYKKDFIGCEQGCDPTGRSQLLIDTISPPQDVSDTTLLDGIAPQKDLELEFSVIDFFYKNFRDHLHILHPFIEIWSLEKWIEGFKNRYGREKQALQINGSIRGKRKRTAAIEDSAKSNTHAQPRMPKSTGIGAIDHSISKAIVLLVLALGQICAHKTPLIRPLSASTGIQKNNVNVIPGLMYYHLAAEIISRYAGQTDIIYTQASLLAALYMGQLAQTLASYQHIWNACFSCQILINS